MKKNIFLSYLSVFILSIPLHALSQSKIKTVQSIHDFKNFTVTPSKSASTGFTMELKAIEKFSTDGFSANINGQEYVFYDNGKGPDKKAGDGIYTAFIKEKVNSKTPVTYNVDEAGTLSAINSGNGVNNAGLIPHCEFHTVKCPPDCKSVIFHRPCVICIEFSCHT